MNNIIWIVVGWIIASVISYIIKVTLGKYLKPKKENGKIIKSDMDWKVKIYAIVSIIHQIVISPIHLIFMVIYIFPAVYTGVKFGWREYSDEVRWMYNTVKKYIIQNINYVKGIY